MFIGKLPLFPQLEETGAQWSFLIEVWYVIYQCGHIYAIYSARKLLQLESSDHREEMYFMCMLIDFG